MKATIISCGDELVTGQCVDTNSAWLSQQLLALGVPVRKHLTLSDNAADLADAIALVRRQDELLIITGGLGPTADDVTRDGISAAMTSPLEENHVAMRQVREFFDRWGRVMPESNKRQALIPRGANVLSNPCGTAPGIHCALDDFHLFALPGVPAEMKAMFAEHIVPILQSHAGAETILTAKLQCFGISEARLGELLSDLMKRGRNPSVGTTASHAVLSVRVISRGPAAGAKEVIERDCAEIKRRLGNVVFGEGDDTLQLSVAHLLRATQKTVSVAESCTGGLIAKCLTDVPGSSDYFSRGYVTYDNKAKIELLGVPVATLDVFGAVSEQAAQAMAGGCRQRAGTDFAIAVTGIAGPTGATAQKPIGLVYVAIADANNVEVSRHLVGDHLSREEIRDRASKIALNLLRLRLIS